MTKFAVLPPMIVVRVPGAQGGETYMRAGRILPESVTPQEKGRLLGLGLIAEVPDEAALIADLEALQADADRTFEERVRARAAEMVAEELAPEFDLRVQEAAERLDAERQSRTADGELTGAVTTLEGEEHAGEIPASAIVGSEPVQAEGTDELPTPAWNHPQLNDWGRRQKPPLVFETDANKATKLALIQKRLEQNPAAPAATV